MKYEKYPFQVEKLDEKSRKLLESFNQNLDVARIGPKGYLQPNSIHSPLGIDLLNFQARKDDVWLFGFQRSGTTMTQEMLWLIKNDLDFEGAAKEIMDIRFPVFSHNLYMKGQTKNFDNMKMSPELLSIINKYKSLHYKALDKAEGNRFIKSHIPISLSTNSIFDVGCKVVYCARHPKDVVVSLFHHLKMFQPDSFKDISFPDFWKLFKNDCLPGTPWFEQVKEGWARRNDKNFLFLFYEDTKKDTRASLLKIAKFLEKDLSEEDLQRLEEHFKIENFRKNKSVNNDHFKRMGIVEENKEFIRKGQIGGWKQYFTPDLNAEADEWIAENLKNSDLILPTI